MGAPWTSAAEKVKPTVDRCTAALPWYEREDCERLWDLAHGKAEMPKGYDVWHAAARVINEWLARGRGLEIVRLKPDEFLSWLDAQGQPDPAASRLKYVEEGDLRDTIGDATRAPLPAKWHIGTSSLAIHYPLKGGSNGRRQDQPRLSGPFSHRCE